MCNNLNRHSEDSLRRSLGEDGRARGVSAISQKELYSFVDCLRFHVASY
jgi:hypothetical protein